MLTRINLCVDVRDLTATVEPQSTSGDSTASSDQMRDPCVCDLIAALHAALEIQSGDSAASSS